MSDTSQGPGWWLATDQRWYPPESHPAYQPPLYPGVRPSMLPGALPADYGLRLGGWLIDWFILLVACGVISALTHSLHYSHFTSDINGTISYRRSFRWGMPGVLISPLIVVAYGTIMCGSKRGQTVGMMVAGTKAVRVSTGAPIGYGRALGRALFEWLLAAILFFPWVLDMLFPLWDPKGQTLHDKVSGSMVVRISRS